MKYRPLGLELYTNGGFFTTTEAMGSILRITETKNKQTTKAPDRWVNTDFRWMLFENGSMSKSKRRWFYWWALASELGGTCTVTTTPHMAKAAGPALQGGLIKASILQQQKGHWLGNSANVGYIQFQRIPDSLSSGRLQYRHQHCKTENRKVWVLSYGVPFSILKVYFLMSAIKINCTVAMLVGLIFFK